ncbi:MAG TPA: putative baseplate assembly protein [Pyrinomonadaceae bacterium]|nr:putative baseplate assembly protein [Pyrinomonadaceae bacterium]
MTLTREQARLALNDCGCCEGLAVETPAEVSNRPGLSAVAYRVGTHARFKASMLARLSGSGLPELGQLKTRDDDDFTIALLDAWAMVADVLTFYQERVANESYLRTATERRSVIHLARLIGYELRPGVAASAYLAFTLETAPGSPPAVTLAEGLRVQSVPGPGERPQTFEIVEAVEARGRWNAMRPRLTELRVPAFGSTRTYLEGVTTGLKKGDMLLFVGEERASEAAGSERWDIRRVTEVVADAENQRTLVRWAEPLGSVVPPMRPGEKRLKIFGMRLRASLFGFNAPEWRSLPVALRVGEVNPKPQGTNEPNYQPFLEGVYAGRETTWADKKFDALRPGLHTAKINLDAVYNQIVLGSWVVLTRPRTDLEPAYGELYRVRFVGEESKSDYNITAKTTRLEISGENVEKFSPRNATVHAHSEELQLAETPIADPVSGDTIVLDTLVEPLAEGKKIVVTGKRVRVVAGRVRGGLVLFSPDDRAVRKPLAAGQELIVLAPPSSSPLNADLRRWWLADEAGFEGYVDAPDGKLTFAPAAEDDETVSEVATVRLCANEDDTHTRLTLSSALANLYDRPTVTINANVGLATHGETVAGEVLGSGDAGRPFQSFQLKQSPLTYTGADTPSGGESTLEVFVNNIRWHEVPTLFGRGPRERVYVTRTDDDRKTTVQFGDGKTGARLPVGRENVKANYRKGVGLEGLVGAGQLSLPMTRPLGLKGVTNPQAASGAQDPQGLADARANSPLTVLTLDRIVSLRDYEDFARSFSGVAKALAAWTWNVHTRGVYVTVAGINGAAVADDSPLRTSLVSAMQKAGDPRVPVKIKSYRGVTFRVVADVKVDPDYVAADVLAAAEAALRASFSFEARAFGQPVTLSEVVAVLQDVPGVVAVDINRLHRADQPEALNTFLRSHAPRPGDDESVPPAELLTLDAGPLELGVLP